MAYNKIENILFDNQQYDEVEDLYRNLLDNDFDGFALNRLVDILLEKNEISYNSEAATKIREANKD